MADARARTKQIRDLSSRYEYSMFRMFDRIGNHLTQKDLNLMTILCGNNIDYKLRRKIKNGKDFLLALSKSGYCDEANFSSIVDLMKEIKRHDLIHMVLTRKKAKVSLDPVEEYLQTTQNQQESCSGCSYSSNEFQISERLSEDESSAPKRIRRSERIVQSMPLGNERNLVGPRKKYTCDVRLRVRAEYCNYHSVLQGNVNSVKPDPIERQLDCFAQASAILRARDLGYIVCDIKFSEITYLDAFWRDYLNGSLLEALKGVFITESLKQAVGNEAIKLLVNVEESDYEKGRILLMKNLADSP